MASKYEQVELDDLNEETNFQDHSDQINIWPEYDSNFFSRVTFHWLEPIFKISEQRFRGNRDKAKFSWSLPRISSYNKISGESGLTNETEWKPDPLQIDDVFKIHPRDAVEHRFQLLNDSWKIENERFPSKPSLLRTIARVYAPHYLLCGIMVFLAMDIGLLTGPILLRAMMSFITDPNQPAYQGYIIAILFFVNSVATSLVINSFWHWTTKIGYRVRTGLLVLLYRKVLRMNSKVRLESGIGKILNMMSNDIEKLVEASWQGHLLWASILQILLAIAFLFYFIGWSALAGLAALGILSPLTITITKLVGTTRRKMLTITDERVKTTSEVLKGIKVVKFYAYEDGIISKISGIRKRELVEIKKLLYFKELNTSITLSAPTLMAIATFTVYSADHQLTASAAFTVLALFSSLRIAMKQLPQVINTMAELRISLGRLESFLAAAEIERPADLTDVSALPEGVVIKVENANFTWNEQSATPTLSDINLEVKEGQLVAIVGPVGAGKSTLVSSLLGETTKIGGSLLMSTKSIAYMAQQPWIFHGSLRDNILFGEDYDPDRYARVLRQCSLEPDLDLLPARDLTEIGDRGVNLSGGQKQRISMARAIYRQEKVNLFLFDDPLSAVDQHVQKQLFNTIQETLKGKTRIIVTHQLQFLPSYDKIVVLDGGKIVAQGSFSELSSQGIDFTKYQSMNSSESKEEDDGSSKSEEKSKKEGESPRSQSKGDNKLVQDEEHTTGTVKIDTYKKFLSAFGGNLYFAFLVFLFIGGQIARSVSDWWLAYWSAEQAAYPDRHSISFYLSIFVGISVGFLVLTLIRALFIVMGGINASTTIHSNLLKGILGAPLLWFHSNPLGRILNRFSRDMQTMDEQLTNTLHQLIDTAFIILAVFAVICINSPWLILTFPPTIYVYYRIQKRFRYASREVKRLDSISRSPIFQHFSEAITGLETLRAYQMEGKLSEENRKKLDANSRVFSLGYCINRWLSTRLELIGASIVFFTALFSAIQKDTLGEGVVGFSLTYALMLTGQLNGLVRFFTDFEMRMNSIERLSHYIDTKPEEETSEISIISDPEPEVSSRWPTKGRIVFSNLVATYSEGAEPVLRGVDCTIQGGEKIGICGRTGAGKSSFVLALFRMLHFEHGSVSIDGVDITYVSLKELRSNLSIVPQDPVLFSGTVRTNLDPLGLYQDDDIWLSLEHSQLKETVQSLDGQLDGVVVEGGENFSVGQRQLMCLARALLQRNKVIVLDEATAAVDYDSDRAIQDVIKKSFESCTMLIIAHRLNTIMDCDRVLVMDAGRIAEFDTPANLLKDSSSIFYSLANHV